MLPIDLEMLTACINFVFNIFSSLILVQTVAKLGFFVSGRNYVDVPLGLYFYQHQSNGDNPLPMKIFINLGLLLLFLIQHSFMSVVLYKGFGYCLPTGRRKQMYAVVSCLVLQTMMHFWQPINNVILWSFDTGKTTSLLSLFFTLVHIFAWFLLILEHLVIYTLQCRGLKDVILRLVFGRKPSNPYFSKRLEELLSHMPHPGAICFAVALWVFPVMTLDKWILATVLTWYMFVPDRVTKKDVIYVKRHTYSESYSESISYGYRYAQTAQ